MVKINEEYYIDADTYSYQLKQVHYAETKKGEQIRDDKTIGYYPTVEELLKGYLKHRGREIVKTKEFSNIQSYMKYIQKLDKELEKLKLEN